MFDSIVKLGKGLLEPTQLESVLFANKSWAPPSGQSRDFVGRHQPVSVIMKSLYFLFSRIIVFDYQNILIQVENNKM